MKRFFIMLCLILSYSLDYANPLLKPPSPFETNIPKEVPHPERSEGSPVIQEMSRKARHEVHLWDHSRKTPGGAKVSLNFQSINIKAVLKLLADFKGINMVVSDKVKGKITLRLKDVPWEQALDIILTTHGLDKFSRGNMMLIDTQHNLNAIKKAKFKSQQMIQKLEPVLSELLQINYAKASDLASMIQDKENSLLSDRGKITVDLRSNTVWIQDTARKIREVKKLVKQLDVPAKQVLIEARIVEVKKDFSRDMGIRWGVSQGDGMKDPLENTDSFQGDQASRTLPLINKLNLDLTAVPLNLVSPATVGVALARINDNILLDLELSALESEGFAELIASPRLITVNQQPAVIDSGEEIPYQETASGGATSVAFRKAVLSLKVIPQITSDGTILMELQINQDTASNQTFNGVPAILTKEIQTRVLANNGQTIVLGGIYTQGKDKSMSRIPFLGQLPLIGLLFKNTQVNLKNDELLIFITPKIIASATDPG